MWAIEGSLWQELECSGLVGQGKRIVFQGRCGCKVADGRKLGEEEFASE